MIKVDVRADLSRLKRALKLTERQLGFAIGKAMNDTAFQARDDWGKHVQTMVDRPKAVTVKSALVERARPNRLIATVYVKDWVPKGTAPLTYLRALLAGDSRDHKRFEKALIRAGVMAQGEYAIPAKGARIDAYGNMAAGQITQILSAVRANPDPLQNVNRRSKRGSKAARSYFLVRGNTGRLVRGIWQRVGNSAVPVLIFTTSRPKYRRRLMFDAVVARTVKRDFVRFFNAAAQREIDRAMARA